FALLFARRGAVGRIMVREARVPPDARVNAFGKLLAFLVGAGFISRTVLVHGVGARDHHLRSFTLAGMHVDLGFSFRTTALRSTLVENIDDVIVPLVELRLSKI